MRSLITSTLVAISIAVSSAAAIANPTSELFPEPRFRMTLRNNPAEFLRTTFYNERGAATHARIQMADGGIAHEEFCPDGQVRWRWSTFSGGQAREWLRRDDNCQEVIELKEYRLDGSIVREREATSTGFVERAYWWDGNLFSEEITTPGRHHETNYFMRSGKVSKRIIRNGKNSIDTWFDCNGKIEQRRVNDGSTLIVMFVRRDDSYAHQTWSNNGKMLLSTREHLPDDTLLRELTIDSSGENVAARKILQDGHYVQEQCQPHSPCATVRPDEWQLVQKPSAYDPVLDWSLQENDPKERGLDGW